MLTRAGYSSARDAFKAEKTQRVKKLLRNSANARSN